MYTRAVHNECFTNDNDDIDVDTSIAVESAVLCEQHEIVLMMVWKFLHQFSPAIDLLPDNIMWLDCAACGLVVKLLQHATNTCQSGLQKDVLPRICELYLFVYFCFVIILILDISAT